MVVPLPTHTRTCSQSQALKRSHLPPCARRAQGLNGRRCRAAKSRRGGRPQAQTFSQYTQAKTLTPMCSRTIGSEPVRK